MFLRFVFMKYISWISRNIQDITKDMKENVNSNIKKYLGIRVRSLRENAGLTQEDLAGVCDVSWRTVSNLERGLVVPDLLMLCKIAKKFNVSLDELLNIELQNHKSLSRIAEENLLIERIKSTDDKLLGYISDQVEVVLKYFS